MNAAEVVQLFGSSVVLIRTELLNDQTRTGSGFFVGSEGVIATSLHLLDGAQSVVVRIEGRRFDVSSIRAFDIERDLAIIQIDDEGFEATVPGDSSSLRRGDTIYVISNPLGLIGTVSEGLLGAWREPTAELVDDPDATAVLEGLPEGRLLQISAPVSHGSSGAPVFDENGYVVGMVTAGLGGGTLDLNFAVPIEALIPLFGADEGWALASLQSTLDHRRREIAEPYLVDARFYLANEQLEKALQALDRALGLFPRSGEALTMKGEVLLLGGRIDEAGELFRRAVEANPESAEAWENFGLFVLNHGSREHGYRAVAAFEKALELDPWRVEAALGLGIAYVAQGHLQKGREMFDQAVDSEGTPGKPRAAKPRVRESARPPGDWAIDVVSNTRVVFSPIRVRHRRGGRRLA